MGDSEQSNVETLVPATANVGQILRDARVAKDLTIDQLATELRIEARQLAALEENRFEQIGVAVFVKGYLRQYAQRLGVDTQQVLAAYNRQVEPVEVQIQPSRTIKLRDERQITVWVVALLLLALIVVGLGVWWLNGGFDVEATTRKVLGGAGFAPSAAPAAAVAASSAPVEPPAATVTTPEPASAAVVASGPAATEPEPAAVADRNEPDVTVGASDEDEPAVVADAGADALALDLTFNGESWTEITDSAGQRLFVGLASAGRHMTLRGAPPLAVVLGNADAVQLKVDGKPFDVPTRGRQGNLARFSIRGDGN
jgi:cytoskeleton protein RodZ